MAQTPEGKVKAKVRKVLAERGAYVHCPMTHGYGSSGVHDILVLFHGRFLSIECKAKPSGKPTALQTKHAREVAAQGGHVLLIHSENIEEVEKTLDIMQDPSIIGDARVVWPE